jgi:hypothetical protein
LHPTFLIIIDLSVILKESIVGGVQPHARIYTSWKLVVNHDLRITGDVDDIYIGDLNTYFDFAKFNKA